MRAHNIFLKIIQSSSTKSFIFHFNFHYFETIYAKCEIAVIKICVFRFKVVVAVIVVVCARAIRLYSLRLRALFSMWSFFFVVVLCSPISLPYEFPLSDHWNMSTNIESTVQIVNRRCWCVPQIDTLGIQICAEIQLETIFFHSIKIEFNVYLKFH